MKKINFDNYLSNIKTVNISVNDRILNDLNEVISLNQKEKEIFKFIISKFQDNDKDKVIDIANEIKKDSNKKTKNLKGRINTELQNLHLRLYGTPLFQQNNLKSIITDRNKKNSVFELNILNLQLFEFSRGNNVFHVKDAVPAKTYKVGDGEITVVYTKGYLNPIAQDIMNYLFTLIPTIKKDNNFAIDTDKLNNEGIEFTIKGIINSLGLTYSGENRNRVKNELEKLAEIALTFRNCYTVKHRNGEIEKVNIRTTGLCFLEMNDYKNNSNKPRKDLKSKIMFEPFFIYNLENNFYRITDFNYYLSIPSGISKRIYNILISHNQQDKWLCGLEKFAEMIPITAKRKNKLKQSLKKNLESLMPSFLKSYKFYKNDNGEEIIEFVF